MIDAPKGVLTSLGRLPKIIDNETFKQWKQRVLGDSKTKVMVYVPYEPSPQTRISTLQKDCGGDYLNLIFSRYGRFKDKQTSEATQEVEQDIIEQLSTLPKETLQVILDDLEGKLEPSVEEFFKRYLDSEEENIDTESIMKDLIGTYNSTVKQWREKA